MVELVPLMTTGCRTEEELCRNELRLVRYRIKISDICHSRQKKWGQRIMHAHQLLFLNRVSPSIHKISKFFPDLHHWPRQETPASPQD
jgi:hypothetical protein